MSDTLELVEAVPLGVAVVCRLLSRCGIRVLAVKGPAFAALGTRAPRESHDIDVLVHPADRDRAATALHDAGWQRVSYWFPRQVDDLVYSTTFVHPTLPCPADVHHRFKGLFAPPAEAFDRLWARRTQVEVAHQSVPVPCLADAVVLETVNRLGDAGKEQWPAVSGEIAERARQCGLGAEEMAGAADALGAEHSVAHVVTALGGPAPTSPPPVVFLRWQERSGRPPGPALALAIVRRAPLSLPLVVWTQLRLPEASARLWATSAGVPYQGRARSLAGRVNRLVRGLARQAVARAGHRFDD